MGRKTLTCLRRVRCEWNELFFRCFRAPRNHILGSSERSGEMSEWFKEHAWRACNPKGFVGSNPTLSAEEMKIKENYETNKTGFRNNFTGR